jgi:hypothetical protein
LQGKRKIYDFIGSSGKVQEATYVSIVRAKGSHTIIEILLPACKVMIKIVLNPEATTKISEVSPSVGLTRRRLSYW